MRVLIVEDSPHLRASLVQGLREHGFAVDSAADGKQGLACAQSDPYDVVVLDWMLPKMDGLSMLQALRRNGIETHVIMLTAREDIDDRVTGLHAGADDYLVKPFAFPELLARLRALTRRAYRKKTPAIRVGRLLVDTTHRTAHVADSPSPIRLTPREFAILEYLAYHVGEPVSRQELQGHIYDDHSQVLSNAIDSAMCDLRAKLSAAGCTGLLHTRRKVGYVLCEESEK